MNIYIKIIDGLPYLGSEEWHDAVLSEKEWETLDKTILYSANKKTLVPIAQETLAPLVVLPSLERLLEQGGCGVVDKVDALWSIIIKQERTKADTIVKNEEKIRKEYEEAQKKNGE